MTVTHPRIEAFVESLRRIAAEDHDPRAIVEQVRPLVAGLCQSRDWVSEDYYRYDPQQRFGVHVLHEEDDHTLAVFAVSWAPGVESPPHNHGTWAVVGGVDGVERNVGWRRFDDGSKPGYAEIRPVTEMRPGPGDVMAFLPDDIHSVANDGDSVTLSLHVYGKHVNYTDRDGFDPSRNTVDRFIVTLER